MLTESSWAAVPPDDPPAPRDDASVASAATSRSDLDIMNDRMRAMAQQSVAQVANIARGAAFSMQPQAPPVTIHVNNAAAPIAQNAASMALFSHSAAVPTAQNAAHSCDSAAQDG